MAANKRYQPTSKKLKKAREDGDVAKSRSLTGTVTLVVLIVVLFQWFRQGREFLAMIEPFFGAAKDFHTNNMLLSAKMACTYGVLLIGPPLGAAYVAAWLIEICQVGFQVSFKSLTFKWSRLNFLSGLKRIAGAQQGEEAKLGVGILLEIARVLFLLVTVSVVWTYKVGFKLPALSQAALDSESSLTSLLEWLIKNAATGPLLVLLVFGAGELVFARWKRTKRLRMDVQEMKNEMRENEGSPEVKGMRKQLHQELVFQNIVDSVRRSKIVIVNREPR